MNPTKHIADKINDFNKNIVMSGSLISTFSEVRMNNLKKTASKIPKMIVSK